MAGRPIVTMPGDGIGKTVLPEAIRVLDAVGFRADYVPGDIGWDLWCKEGNALPDRTIELLEQHKIGLFGAITSKPKVIDHALLLVRRLVRLHLHFHKQPMPSVTRFSDEDVWYTR